MVKKDVRLLEDAITKAYLLSQKYKDYEESYKLAKNDTAVEIAGLMNPMGISTYTFIADAERGNKFANDPVTITCTRVEPKTVVYDAEKMYNYLDKNDRDALFTKSYEIADFEGLVDLMKKHGITPKEFKKFVKVNPRLNEDKLNKLYELGYITMKDIKGCYTVKKSKGYWKISAKKLSEEKE